MHQYLFTCLVPKCYSEFLEVEEILDSEIDKLIICLRNELISLSYIMAVYSFDKVPYWPLFARPLEAKLTLKMWP